MDAIPRSWRRQWLVTWWLVLAALAGPAAWAGDGADAEPVARGQDMPSPEELERRGATIGRIDIEVGDIFDTSDLREDRMLYRLANDLHYSTRPSTVQDQLLLQPGDLFSAERAAETARMLHEQEYFSDADVLARHYDPDTNTVDLDVKVHDVWTLEPGIGVGRSGGTNRSRLRLADSNFLGLGQQLAVEYKSNVDRSGLGVQFIDPQLLHSRWATQAHYTDTSDGRIGSFVLERPFFALDSRWSTGLAASAIDEVTPVYESGEKVSEFGSSYHDYSVQGGTSRGRVDAVLQADSYFYHRFDGHNTIMAYFAGAHGDGLSEDHPLQPGGDSGLRGYPLRYETGDNRVLHIDLAFPVTPPGDVSKVQLLLQAEKSF